MKQKKLNRMVLVWLLGPARVLSALENSKRIDPKDLMRELDLDPVLHANAEQALVEAQRKLEKMAAAKVSQ